MVLMEKMNWIMDRWRNICNNVISKKKGYVI